MKVDPSKARVDIIPAVLPKTFNQLEEALERIRGVSRVVQVDVTADIFGVVEAMPLWEEFDFEFDLFVEPGAFVARALELGASRIIVHERYASAREALDFLQDKRGGDYAIAVGLGLRATDSVDVLEPYAGLYDFVQVMGIQQEGAQGHPPAPEALDLVRALRARDPALFIQADGAVGPRAREFAEAGANRLIVGSMILKADNPKAAYKQLYTEANGLSQ